MTKLRSPADNAEAIETLNDIGAFFEKEADYERENMGAGGSQIALGRWTRYYSCVRNMAHDLATADAS